MLRCALVSGFRSVCGFDIWVARFGFGGFRRLGCWISGGHDGDGGGGGGSYRVGLICDLWV